MVTFTDAGRRVSASVPRVAQARNLSQAAEVIREHDLRQAHLAAASQVKVSSRFIASESSVIGLEIVSTSTVHGKQIITPATVWYDATRAQSYSGSVLIGWKSWGAFADLVAKQAAQAQLDQAKVAHALAEDAAPYGKGPAIGFNTQGDLVVVFGSGVVAEQSTTLVIDVKDGTPLLSPLGRRAQGAALKPTAFGAPAATLAWKPTASMPKPEQSPNQNPLSDDSQDGPGQPSAEPSDTVPNEASHPSTAIGVDCIVHKCVAITYDDGPGPDTPTLIKTLDQTKSVATFFQMGNSINQFPQTTVAVASAGMEIGDHTMTHADLARLSSSGVQNEVGKNASLQKSWLGRTPLLFRPPYGSHKQATDQIIAANGMAIIQWSIDTNDWNDAVVHQSSTAVVQNATGFSAAYSQPIILMHDIHAWTVDAAPQVIANLQRKGYTLVTVSELTVNTGGLKTGHAYCHGTAETEASAPGWCAG